VCGSGGREGRHIVSSAENNCGDRVDFGQSASGHNLLENFLVCTKPIGSREPKRRSGSVRSAVHRPGRLAPWNTTHAQLCKSQRLISTGLQLVDHCTAEIRC